MIEPGTVEWARDEPEWIGPSDEIERAFYAFVEASKAAYGMFDEEAEILAKLAWKIQADGILWIYFEDNLNPASYGLPSLEQMEDKVDELGEEQASHWAYTSIDDVRKELYWVERENRRLEERKHELNNRSK